MALATHGPRPKMAFSNRERQILLARDDSAIMNQVHATHAPDAFPFAVTPLLDIIEEIFHNSILGAVAGIVHQEQGDPHAQPDALAEKSLQNGFAEMLEPLSITIGNICSEITCKCSSGDDTDAATLAVFRILSKYSWDAKVALALAALAVNYGEFWLVMQHCLTNPLAKGIVLLKQLPNILERSDTLKPKFEALASLITAIIDVARCIVKFNELPSQYITPETPEMATAIALIPTAAYWSIRSIIACASQIIGLIGMGHEYIESTKDAWELSGLAHKVRSIQSHLMKQLIICNQLVDEKIHFEAYQGLKRLLQGSHIDNLKIIRALIHATEDQQPLYDGDSKKRVSLDVLRRKNVLLLISDLDLRSHLLSKLVQIYSEAKQHPGRPESQYELVWFPIVDRSTPFDDTKLKQFEDLKLEMPWYSVHHPSLLDPAVIRYIKEDWNFNKEPLLVVLDTQGRVVNRNAIHMIWIWESVAYPFTHEKEEALWRDETWRTEFLLDGIHAQVLNSAMEGKFICLYGGEDMGWIRNFTQSAKAVAEAAGIPLEMLYVGKSKPREKVQRNNKTVAEENLSHYLQNLTLIWFFWLRLESMLQSKIQHKRNVENDPIMLEVERLLTFDGSDQCWAVVSRGPDEMVKASGDLMLEALRDYESWQQRAEEDGFVPALEDHLRGLHSPLHCCRLILPGAMGSVPDRVTCAECGKTMEKFIMYRCCND
ncbi:hypothetical protein K2173_002655 [Erythroxylum novogranatense]|uniref:Protein SIEVE ELEMENT OCCLUSION B-like n=1 Tax=Erythroxylum novogranatense TaxID=1862640 RepID=A0AAV8SWP7_9ROSI|nr:hypothetical protein K2173_002655 [Erythroxylum novogranatense]